MQTMRHNEHCIRRLARDSLLAKLIGECDLHRFSLVPCNCLDSIVLVFLVFYLFLKHREKEAGEGHSDRVHAQYPLPAEAGCVYPIELPSMYPLLFLFYFILFKTIRFYSSPLRMKYGVEYILNVVPPIVDPTSPVCLIFFTN